MISDLRAGGRRRLLCAALISPLAVGLPGLSASARENPALPPAEGGFPRRLIDTLGRELFIARAPQRIVVIFPSNIEIAYAIGLEERIAAIGGRVVWPEEALAKPSVGGALGYSAEVVASLRPDLVVLTPSHQTALNLIVPFERIGVPVLVLQHPDLPSILRNIHLLGRATGSEAAADEVAGAMQRGLVALSRRLRGMPRRRVFLETGAAGNAALQTVGRNHYADDALLWAGGENVFSDLVGSQQVSHEALFLRDPEVIVALQHTDDPAEATRRLSRRPGWHALRAVRQGRVVVLPRRHQLIPGPRQVEAVAEYARAIHPEAFHG